MNTIKYIACILFGLSIIISIILGIGAAESEMWGWAMILLFSPFILAKFLQFGNMIHYCEVYSRAWNIKSKNSK